MTPPREMLSLRCPTDIAVAVRSLVERTRLDRTTVLVGLLRRALGSVAEDWTTDQLLEYLAPSAPTDPEHAHDQEDPQ